MSATPSGSELPGGRPSLRFGLYIANGWAAGSVTAMVELARAAEEAGWESFFIWDQLLVEDDNPAVDAQIALAAVATATSPAGLRRLGALVTPLGRRRVWKYARELVALQELSGGRMVAGFGLGEGADYGISSDELGTDKARAAALEDGLELLQELFTGEPVAWQRPAARSETLGREARFSTKGFKPPPAPAPPIWLAGTIRRQARQPTAPFRRAARYQGLFPTPYPWDEAAPLTPSEIARAVDLTFPDGVVPEGFEFVACGLTRGPRASVSLDELANYADAGVTTWLEAMPEQATLEEMHELIGAGPPSLAE
jgi:alkanesulfonate monooxygenase SsuD/methylene tetrahydromethanopterin reductase-like flavin-dependent oxidoreductase (luciferase family)